MATPTNDTYFCASGEKIYAGRLMPFDGDWICTGDSLTDFAYTSSGIFMGMALTKRTPKFIWNAGIQATSITDTANRMQTTIDNYPSAKNYLIRIGTNGVGSGGSGNYQTEFLRIMNTLISNDKRAVFLAIPPKIGMGDSTTDSAFKAQNAWLKSQCDANPSRFVFIYDSDRLALSTHYDYDATCYIDGIHPNGKGTVRQSQDMKNTLCKVFPASDVRVLTTSDIYPANPASNQYGQNPTMTGTSGTKGSFVTGTVVDSLDIRTTGGSATTAVASVVSADGNDPVQIPWQRSTLTAAGGNGHEFRITANLLHPAIAADTTIPRFEIVSEIRFANLDTSVMRYIKMELWDSGNHVIGKPFTNLLQGAGTLNESMILRWDYPRNQGTSNNTIALDAYAANSVKLVIYINYTGAQATSMGAIDVRCLSVRGLTT